MGVYVVKCYIHGGCCLSMAYKSKAYAIKRMERFINGGHYDAVRLVLQNAVYIADTELILKEWEAAQCSILNTKTKR